MKIKNSNITINVDDIEKSISFYESIEFILNEGRNNHYAQLSANGIMIGLHPTNKPNILRNSGIVSIGFKTEDFEETKIALKAIRYSNNRKNRRRWRFSSF